MSTTTAMELTKQMFCNIHQVDFAGKVEQLRELIYEYARQDAKPEIDFEEVKARIPPPGELENVGSNPKMVQDWMLKRLLIAAKVPLDLQSAFDKFCEVFQFRSKYQISKLTLENTIPREFFSLGIFFSDKSLEDRKGNRLFIVRAKYYKKLPQLDDLLKRGGLYIVERHDREFEQGHFDGVALLLDMTDFDYRNINLDLVKFALKTGAMYAGPFKSILIYNLPWAFTFVLRWAESLVTLMLGFKLNIFHLVNQNNITDFVDKEKLPEFLNGTFKADFTAPPNAFPFDKFFEPLGDLIEPANVLKIKEYLQEIM